MDGPEIATTLAIKGLTAGKAKVTVTAYDGVNAPINAMIDVTVVLTNSVPTVTSTVADLQTPFDAALKTEALGKLYLTGSYGGAKSFKFKAQISTGAEGKTEDGDSTKFVVTYGADGTATSAIATATVSPAPTSTALVEYTVTVTPLKAGSETITIEVKDSFGLSSVVGTADGEVAVIVNKPPTVQMDAMKMPVTMKDVTLYVSGADGDVAIHSPDPVLVAPKGVVYNVATYFVIEDVPPDTRCTFSASPSTAVGVQTASTTLATVMFVDGTVLTATAERAGTFDVTLTCSDKEATVTDSARVTVYN